MTMFYLRLLIQYLAFGVNGGFNMTDSTEIKIVYDNILNYQADIKMCANKLSNTEKIKNLSKSSGKAANEINNAINQLNCCLKNLAEFCSQLDKGYQNIIDKFKQTDSIASGLYPTLVGTISVTSQNESVAESSASRNATNISYGQVLNDIWQKYPTVSLNGFTNYNGKGNCTWYVDNRWNQLNPDYPLRFTAGSKNAMYWDDRIDKYYYNVDTANSSTVKSNTIAVSESGQYGHVAYIENVKEGMVYYTEDGEAYTRPHTWAKDENGNWIGPIVQSCSVEEFCKKFGKIISAI